MTIAAWVTALLLTAGADAQTAPPPPPPPPVVVAPVPPPPPPPLAPPAPERDAKALAAVKKMSDRLQQAKTFSLKARVTMELPASGGVLATFVNDASATVQRPDKLAAVRSGDLPEFRFAYDGKTMTISTPGNGRWATAAAPPTLEAMLIAAGEQAGLSFPFDEILVADPYAVITRDLTQATLVGQATLGGKKTDHVLLTSPRLELQLWNDQATSLPVRVAVVYADSPLRPHFSIDYSEWKLDPKLPASTFALTMPKGATPVEFRAAAATFR